ncbi:LysM peptidoglycan-binding domain-containing protein [Epidermidibacterium keratini]|uniref:LysM peptidoglycan-binding domain-containing protein n=1 Tax=Epidermidibacterium keratini TaxID=1891644 RepID=A0A7L4YRN5_9ACTN|nr:LysM domain-containing protein [Epidermidibacterium keratini]QHC01574.1 LysM peptidoglycan-binding domain-containing protein [Epidermidibacterium keratini]
MRIVWRAGAWELALATTIWLLAPSRHEVWDLVRAPQAFVDSYGADAAALVVASAVLCAICGVLVVAVALTAVAEIREQPACGIAGGRAWPVMQLAALMVGAAVLPAACAPVGAPASTSTSATAEPSQDAGPTVIDQFDWPAEGAEQAPPVTTQPPTTDQPETDQPASPEVEPPPATSPPPVADGEPAAGGTAYTVVAGDCLWSIAAQQLGPNASLADIADAVDDLWSANAEAIGSDPDRLLPGQVLQLPFGPPISA